MTQEEILEGNKLIAEFMGCYGSIHYCGNEEIYAYGFKDTHITERWIESKFNNRTPYHESWDWLMPVVEKIESLKNSDDYEIDIFGNCCDIGGRFEAVGETKIAAVYIAVIEFIKWHKTQIK